MDYVTIMLTLVEAFVSGCLHTETHPDPHTF